MPRQLNRANPYEGMYTFSLNESSEASSSSNPPDNAENGENSLGTIPDDNSASMLGNSNLTWSPEMIRHFLTVMKTNYMSLKRDEGVTTWASFVEELKRTIQSNNHGNMLGVNGYDVDAFIENITAEKARSKWNSMVNTYNRINQHIGISGIGGMDGQSAWEYYDEVEKITRDDPSINPVVHLESMDMGVTGSHYYRLRDSVPVNNINDNNNSDHSNDNEEVEEVEVGRDDDEDSQYDRFFVPIRGRAIEDHVTRLHTLASSLHFMHGWRTPTPPTPFPATPVPMTPMLPPTTATPSLSAIGSTRSVRTSRSHRRSESEVGTRSRSRRGRGGCGSGSVADVDRIQTIMVEANAEFRESANAQASRFFERMETVLNEERRRTRKDMAVFERNVRQRHEDAERNRNERHRRSESIMQQLLALGEHIVNQNNVGHSGNANNNNNE